MFFAFPGCTGLRSGRRYSGANPPNYKEDYIDSFAYNFFSRKGLWTYSVLGPPLPRGSQEQGTVRDSHVGSPLHVCLCGEFH